MSGSPHPRPRILVACIGNGLVADDAFGCAVHERLASLPLAREVRLTLIAVGGLRLLDELRGEEFLIVVDAVQLGAPVGTLHVLDWDELPAAPGLPVTSHGIGLREAVDVGRALGEVRMPDTVVLIGVEGGCFDGVGTPMTPVVEGAVDPAADEVLRRIRRVLSQGSSGASRR